MYSEEGEVKKNREETLRGGGGGDAGEARKMDYARLSQRTWAFSICKKFPSGEKRVPFNSGPFASQ